MTFSVVSAGPGTPAGWVNDHDAIGWIFHTAEYTTAQVRNRVRFVGTISEGNTAVSPVTWTNGSDPGGRRGGTH